VLARSIAVFVFVFVFGLAPALSAFAADKKPPVPPGVDPGGVEIAIIGPGVDYTDPEIAKRLARDGEGEIIGWDFVDNDRRPFQRDGEAFLPEFVPNRIYKRLASEAASSRFEFFRIGHTNGAQLEKQLVSAIGMAAQSPAQILLLTSWTFPLLDEISRRFPDRFIIAATNSFRDLTQSTNRGSNILVVGGANQSCPNRHNAMEVATASDCLSVEITDILLSPFADHPGAAARIAALAARLKAAEPKITATEMKQRILSLAKPMPDGASGPRPYSWIEDPMSHFPGK
jgi:hypothetical protein